MNFHQILRTTALLLIPLVTGNSLAFAAGNPMTPAQIKAKLEKRGIGHGIRISFEHQSDRRGIIAGIGEESCVLTSPRQAQPVTVNYADIVAIHNDRGDVGKKVGIGIAVGVGAAVVVTIIVAVVLAAKLVGSNTP